jgi:hypothetical protein
MPSVPISRRAVLAGGAGLVLLSACGSSHPSAGSSNGSKESGEVLLELFDGAGSLVPGSPQRLAFAIGDSNGDVIADGPTSLQMTLTPPHGKALAPIEVARHRAGLPRAYYPLTFTPQAAGFYGVRAKGGGLDLSGSFEIGSLTGVKVTRAGELMPVVDTPTLANHRGVDPICTHTPVCPLHTVNLRDALAAHQPIALLIATPGYCQVAICGPVLDVFLAGRAAFPGITYIHSEVYDKGSQVATEGAQAPLAPLLDALHIAFEPALYLIDQGGRVVRRVDVIFDQLELRQVLHDLRV